MLLSTAAIILSFQAVGRERSLSNPHHGIGVALYTLVMVQALGGSVIHKLEKGKERYKIPLKLMVRPTSSTTLHQLTQIASSMVRSGDCAPRNCPSPTWIDLVRFTEGPFHIVRCLDLHPARSLLCPVVQKPTGYGLR